MTAPASVMFRVVQIVLLVVCSVIGGLLAGAYFFGHHPGAVHPQAMKMNAKTAPAKPVKRKILYYWDSMVGASSISSKPGISSMGMPLTPVYAPVGKAAVPGQVRVVSAMVQDMGIQTAPVTVGPLIRRIHTVGTLRVAASERFAITMRAGGWIGKLFATTNGAVITQGQPLFTLYSPRIVAAEQQLLAARQNLKIARTAGVPQALAQARALLRGIRGRLAFLGVDNATITHILKTGRAQIYVTFRSPATGVLADVKVRQKSRVKAGMTVIRIDNLATLWLDSYVYENQLPWLAMEQQVIAHVAAFPGKVFAGHVIFIDPFENPKNHTIIVRMSLKNPHGLLRPGMYALTDILSMPVHHAILAPRRAVIETGTKDVVFVEVSHGRFNPVTVRLGLTGSHGQVQVLSGLLPGEKVVVSGQFMMDVESRINQVKARYLSTNSRHTAKAASRPAGGAP